MNPAEPPKGDDPKPKQPYNKPTIKAQGNVEDLTLKDIGFSDAFLFRGGGMGGGGGGAPGSGGSFNAS